MAYPQPFRPVKLVCGIIAGPGEIFSEAEKRLVRSFGKVDHKSPLFPFTFTEYYARQMGPGLKRLFLSFRSLVPPERLSRIKLQTNRMEESIRSRLGVRGRAVNLDPGILTPSALFMATAKDFAHRVPLRDGIYAHLELLFGRSEARPLDWTYPDFRSPEYQAFFLEVRRVYLRQLREG